ncbi:hypothetical protein G6F29_007809 [Rhizopus arrhizus]|nr:hypothetical protein G6F19_008404 [Rhizopus arrhizus]KAG0937585.1 hypothetical protein G6F30_008217 [Rhizopus arrhizus]KAG0938603.1 hypothetical protein G6F32_009387 [Rhizopus arrhizus]KAG0980462.1 hypothetical protein G6F29_007809 [Rhizopus arrhizus]KAG1006162.1 hypothetical protein G6F27_008558 [Rhizopus arrhizus]
MVEKVVGIDVSCQTEFNEQELSNEKLVKYRKMKRKLVNLIRKQKELKGLLNASQRRKLALSEKKSKSRVRNTTATTDDPMDISEDENEDKEEIGGGDEEEEGDSSEGEEDNSEDEASRKKRRRYAKKRHSIPRAEDGSIQLPVQIASLKVIDLGRIEYERPSFHNERYIFPIGYTAERTYMSMVDPSNQTVYTCKVEDSSDGPLFTLWSADAPDQCLSAKTATGVWALVIKKVNEVRQKDSSNAISGPEYYGFSNPLVREMIEELPNVDKLPIGGFA